MPLNLSDIWVEESDVNLSLNAPFSCEKWESSCMWINYRTLEETLKTMFPKKADAMYDSVVKALIWDELNTKDLKRLKKMLSSNFVENLESFYVENLTSYNEEDLEKVEAQMTPVYEILSYITSSIVMAHLNNHKNTLTPKDLWIIVKQTKKKIKVIIPEEE